MAVVVPEFVVRLIFSFFLTVVLRSPQVFVQLVNVMLIMLTLLGDDMISRVLVFELFKLVFNKMVLTLFRDDVLSVLILVLFLLLVDLHLLFKVVVFAFLDDWMYIFLF